MAEHFLQYFRCPESFAAFRTISPLAERAGYFHWGPDGICYGRVARADAVSSDVSLASYDAEQDQAIRESLPYLPFDPEEVTENLQRERYSAHFRHSDSLMKVLVRKLYYLLRPLLSVPLRKHLQKVHLRNWDKIPFPTWPVDFTLDRLQRKRLALAMKAQGVDRVPFIWFWPDNFTSCAIITHDVEAPAGRDFCAELMNLDASFGFRSSFQVVPEDRYEVPKEYLDSIKKRGFEVNIHDLKHDGRLYAEHNEFVRRAGLINQYGRDFGARGFRSGVLYRNADWYDALDFLYDMSIPNVAHLDPQRGGCCSVMPFFVGKIIELPLTCTQDYTLFHILNDYSCELWKKQIALIRSQHGLISMISHPDYLIEARARSVYADFLRHLADLRDRTPLWTPLPREVAEWWQQRSQMRLVDTAGEWRIEGPGAERARIAYAHAADDDVNYTFEGCGDASGVSDSVSSSIASSPN
jgi:hypothetical protein